MGSNRFGEIFCITTWGESHGPAIGVVIDGCPAGLKLDVSMIQQDLYRRRPGRNPHTSPRQETDELQILSGVFEGVSTGAPISLIIYNVDVDSSKYEPIRDLYRPGHANYTYEQKWGHFDYRGGGRASARETACRVAAGAIAKQFLAHFGITLFAELKQDDQFQSRLEAAVAEGDSIGGVVELRSSSLPVGLGEPVYEKIEAKLAKAMLSLPASKGVEFGSGFRAAEMLGSEHNDLFTMGESGDISFASNHAGGTLGGITSGLPLVLRVAFKPTSSIKKVQQTLSRGKEKKELSLPEGSRHDPCVALRAPPIVEAMAALVLADALLLNRCAKI